MSLAVLNTIGDAFVPEARKVLQGLGTVTYETPTQERLASIIGSYDVILCGLANTFTAELLDKAGKLKVMATVTTGLDHIDLEAAELKGITVLSLRGEEAFLNTISGTAELALGLLISSARKIPAAAYSVLKGTWDRDAFAGHSLRGATLGVVGLGRLGRMMATYGSSLRMNVVFTDPHAQSKNPWKKVSFDELLQTSDYVSIHVHLSPETEYMFNATTFGRMKKGAVLVNTSRGKIVNEKELIQALETGLIAGYATDVLDGETAFLNKDCSAHPLVVYAGAHPEVIIVPHIGGMTYESRRDTDVFIARKLADFLKK